MPDLTLYHAKPSRGMIAKWILEELGIDYGEKILVLDNQDHKTPEFLALNPMGRVPVDSPFRADYLRWLFFAPVSAELAILWQALGATTPNDYLPFASGDDVAKTLCEAVRGKEYVIDDRFTAADVMLGSTIYWGLNLMPVLPRHSELVEYWARLSKRAAWQRAIV